MLTSPDELAQLDDAARSIPRDWSLIASHLFGTCRMGADDRDGVVGFDGAVHGVGAPLGGRRVGLPGNLGVNPQHTIMALAMLLAEQVAAGG